MQTDQSLTEYLALRNKVDDFCAAATRASGDALRCEAGCSGCCVGGLTVSVVEAKALERALRHLSAQTLDELRTANEAADTGCALIDQDDRCTVYEARPLVCRTQGLALAYPGGVIPTDAIMGRDAAGRDVTHCPLNFEHAPPEPAATLDAGRVDQLLALVNYRFCEAHAFDADERIALAAMLEAS